MAFGEHLLDTQQTLLHGADLGLEISLDSFVRHCREAFLSKVGDGMISSKES